MATKQATDDVIPVTHTEKGRKTHPHVRKADELGVVLASAAALLLDGYDVRALSPKGHDLARDVLLRFLEGVEDEPS